MSSTTVIRAARAVVGSAERRASVVVRDATVLDVVEALDPGGAEVVELAADRVLLPGLVDCHVHVNEPGRTEWEGFATATAAAAAGGVTTIVDMPLNSIPPTIDVEALDVKRAAAAGQLAVDVAFWGGAVPGNAEKLAGLHEAGVVGFKCFLLPSGVDYMDPMFVNDQGSNVSSTLQVILFCRSNDRALISQMWAFKIGFRAEFILILCAQCLAQSAVWCFPS